MSYFDRIGGKFNPVPQVPTAKNHQLKNQSTLAGVIGSAVWGKTVSEPGQLVPFTITLNKLAIAKNAIVEFLFNQPNLSPQMIGTPTILPAASKVITGHWTCPNRRGGWYTFRVRIDNQSATSNELTLVDDPVLRAVRRNNTDGFDIR